MLKIKVEDQYRDNERLDSQMYRAINGLNVLSAHYNPEQGLIADPMDIQDADLIICCRPGTARRQYRHLNFAGGWDVPTKVKAHLEKDEWYVLAWPCEHDPQVRCQECPHSCQVKQYV